MVELDYLVIGHATRDLKEDSFAVGGTAAYASRTARALGCRVGVITSTDADLDLSRALPDVLIARYPAPTTTTFENITTDGKRQQVIHHVARTLVPAMTPDDWQAAIVHIGPVAQECHPALASAFGKAFVGVTPQGWMRQWDETGRVSHCRRRGMEDVLARADAVVLSLEDVEGNWGLAAEYAAQTRLLALTQGTEGCTIYAEGETRHFPAPDVAEEDSTGAGDIFATSFFYALQRGRASKRGQNPWTAGRFANCVAAQSVTRSGLSGTPSAEEVARCRRATLRGHSAQPSEDGEGDAHHLRAG
ncbi:MAG: PfkB family carbohydrate kinase [Anaerolineae bacterium]|jgi:sugar/nucleoside kinase (ribokinase family)